MKTTIFAIIALAGMMFAQKAEAQAYSPSPAIFYLEAASADPSAVGKQVDFDGNVCTSANPEDSVGIVAEAFTGGYSVFSPMWYTGNVLVSFAGTSTAFPAGAWLVLDSNGDHVLETDPGNQVRVARVADHEDNVYSFGLTDKVCAVPVHPHYGAAQMSATLNRSNHTGTQSASTISDFSTAALSSVTWSTLTGKPSFASVATSGAYNDLSGKPALGTAAAQNSTAFATAAQGTKADSAVQTASAPLVVTGTNLTISAATTSAAGSMSSADKTKLDGLSSTVSFANTSRSFNSGYSLSASKHSQVTYTVRISSAITLGGAQSGRVILEYADDSGFTTNNVEVSSAGSGLTGTVIIGVGVTNPDEKTLHGMVPPNKFVRLRTENFTGTPTYTFLKSQEVTLPF